MTSATKSNILLTAIAFCASVMLAPAPALSATQLEGNALLDALAGGGYVIYMRHTKTDKAQKDGNITDYADCSTQRNLTDEGREQARTVGKLFRERGIKLEQVLSSPYCRAVETGKLAFGEARQEDNLRYLTRLNRQEAETATAWLKNQFSTAPASGTNRILIAHTANLKKGVGIWPKNSGDIYVFQPMGGGNFELVGSIAPDQWPGLLKTN